MFLICCVKDGRTFIHSFRPKTLEAALRIGHELTRDFVADYFKVIK